MSRSPSVRAAVKPTIAGGGSTWGLPWRRSGRRVGGDLSRARRVAPRGGRLEGAAAEHLLGGQPNRATAPSSSASRRCGCCGSTMAAVTSRSASPARRSDGPISMACPATWRLRRRSAASRSPSGAGSPRRRSRSPRPTDGIPIAMPRRHSPPPAVRRVARAVRRGRAVSGPGRARAGSGGAPGDRAASSTRAGRSCVFVQRRLDDAVAAFQAAERMQGVLGSEHPVNARAEQSQAAHADRAGDRRGARRRSPPAAAGARLAEMRIAAAAVSVAEGRAEQAANELVPVAERSARPFHPGTMIEASRPTRWCASSSATAPLRPPSPSARSRSPSRTASSRCSRSSASASCSSATVRTAPPIPRCALRSRHAGRAHPRPSLELPKDPLSDAELRVLRCT